MDSKRRTELTADDNLVLARYRDLRDAREALAQAQLNAYVDVAHASAADQDDLVPAQTLEVRWLEGLLERAGRAFREACTPSRRFSGPARAKDP